MNYFFFFVRCYLRSRIVEGEESEEEADDGEQSEEEEGEFV